MDKEKQKTPSSKMSNGIEIIIDQSSNVNSPRTLKNEVCVIIREIRNTISCISV